MNHSQNTHDEKRHNIIIRIMLGIWSFLLGIWYFITFKSYKRSLLTLGASSYLTVISVIVTLAAASEAFAWGNFGKTFTPDNPLYGAIGLGVFIFLFFWFFDRTMMTQDLAAVEHGKILKGEDYQPNFWEKQTPKMILIARLFIVIGSLFITANYLTQFVFKTDIQNEMERQYSNEITIAKDKILGKLEADIAQQVARIESLHEKLQAEIGGKNSGRYGIGPVAQAMQQELDSAQAALESQQQNYTTTKAALEESVRLKDESTLINYNILVPKDSPQSRAKVIEKLRQQPEFKQTEHTIHGLLLIVGLVLILSKLLQPQDLKLYYSGRLQEAFGQYRMGSYDEYLPKADQSHLMSKQAMPNIFLDIAIRYTKTKEQREKEHLIRQQREKEAEERQYQRKLEEEKRQYQLEEEERLRQRELEESKRIHSEREAGDIQEKSYQKRVLLDKLKREQDRQKDAYAAKERFISEFGAEIDALKHKQTALQDALLEKKRIYESKQEDENARQKRHADAKQELQQREAFVHKLEINEDKDLGEVKTYRAAQKAVREQKNKIKKLEDDKLTFDRDINIHKEAIANLEDKLSETKKRLKTLQTTKEELDSAILESTKDLLVAQDAYAKLDTPYSRGTEAELPHIAQQLEKDGEYTWRY